MCLTLVGMCGSYGKDMRKGYCWLHDREYRLDEPDAVCPQCLSAREKDLEWRSDDE